MPLIPWRPFWDIDKFFEEDFEDWFERPRWGLRKWMEETSLFRTPRMDIYEDNGNVVAEVELPGVDPKNIDVQVKDNILKVEAKAQEKKEVKEKGYWKKEMGARYFKRQVALPTEVIGEKAEAEYGDGVLKIIIPKAKKTEEKEKKVKIKIKQEKSK